MKIALSDCSLIISNLLWFTVRDVQILWEALAVPLLKVEDESCTLFLYLNAQMNLQYLGNLLWVYTVYRRRNEQVSHKFSVHEVSIFVSSSIGLQVCRFREKIF